MQGTIVNSAAHHTMHHLYFHYNYGQFTTLWDRLGGSHKDPDPEFFDSSSKLAADTWQTQATMVDTLRNQVEGNDERESSRKKGQ